MSLIILFWLGVLSRPEHNPRPCEDWGPIAVTVLGVGKSVGNYISFLDRVLSFYDSSTTKSDSSHP